MTRVLIADGHVLTRKGWGALLAETADLRVCGEAISRDEAADRLAEGGFDLVVLDLELPGSGGTDFLKELRRRYPNVAVLVHTALSEEQYGPRSLRAGAAGFLSKTADCDVLLHAVRKAGRGGKYVSPALAEVLAFHLEAGLRHAPHETLSDREYQVFCLLAAGKQVSQIAKELSLSVKTISTFRSRVLTKLAMRTNADITRYALKQGLVD